MIMKRCIIFFFVLTLLLLPFSPAYCEPGFSLVTMANGVYVIAGSSLERVAALDFTITYDQEILTHPAVVKGELVPADARFIVNTAIPGEVRIMVVRDREISGSGGLATITFEPPPARGGGILSFKAQPVSVTAVPLDARSWAGERDRTGPIENAPAVSAAAAVAAAQPAVLPAAVPGVQGSSSEDGGTASGSDPLTKERPSEGHNLRHQSLLDRFRDYDGERTPAALFALFDGTQTVDQEPVIALSDGAAQITVRLTVRPEVEPVFSLEGATLRHVDSEGGRWVVTVLPERGVLRASVTVQEGDDRTEYPLAVAPPLAADAAGIILDESGLGRYLAEGSSAPDLNGDGLHDYTDDFIFAANVYVKRPRRE